MAGIDVDPTSEIAGRTSGTVGWFPLSSFAGNGLPLGGGTMGGPIALTTTDTLVSTGTNQASAALLDAQLCVAISCPAGTAFRLPSTADISPLGAITLKNKSANDATVYPPIGGQVDAAGTNAPVIVSANGEATFFPGSTTGQWWA